ncbi:MAG: tetratricopeptide repeat protein [Bacteroidota bacterium]
MALISPESIDQDTVVIGINKELTSYKKKKDTIGLIQSHLKLAHFYSNRVMYGKSYDNYWQALFLAEASHLPKHVANCYGGLATLYSLYERRAEAREYLFKSLAILKEQVVQNQLDSSALLTSYFQLVVHYRYNKNPVITQAYLDTCKMLSPDGLLIQVEAGYLEILKKNYSAAEKMLLVVEADLTHHFPSYMVIYYSLLGEMYEAMERPRLAMECYQKAILKAHKYLKHLNFVPDIYLRLSEVAAVDGRYKTANELLKTGNSINRLLYSSRSENNRYLLEIKDQERIEKEKKEKLIQRQRIAQLEYEEQVWTLRVAVLVVTILLLLFAINVYVRRIRRKHLQRQQELKQQQEMQQQKNREILSIKNGELTNSTLQIIAKDELLSKLKRDLVVLQKEKNLKEVQSLINTIQLNKDMSWLEFENRFTAVNKDFFERLKHQFPNLQPYDLKICALIKLNFSGKEMARLLGITPESANTSRYRLRKRLGLKKEENLVAFIDSV